MVDDHTLERHAHLKDGGEVLDTVERDLRDVQEPRHTTDLHKRSIWLDCLHMPITSQSQAEGQVMEDNQSTTEVNVLDCFMEINSAEISAGLGIYIMMSGKE